MLPHFFCSKRKHWRQPTNHCLRNMIQSTLCRATCERILLSCVLAIFDDIKIKTTKIIGTKIKYLLHYMMEVVIIILGNDKSLQLSCFTNDPAIQCQHIARLNQIIFWLKPLHISQHKTHRIANTAVTVSTTL